jgi:hypothetical protein
MMKVIFLIVLLKSRLSFTASVESNLPRVGSAVEIETEESVIKSTNLWHFVESFTNFGSSHSEITKNNQLTRVKKVNVDSTKRRKLNRKRREQSISARPIEETPLEVLEKLFGTGIVDDDNFDYVGQRKLISLELCEFDFFNVSFYEVARFLISH